MTENEISYLVRGAIYNIHNNLGPGLLESAYEAALVYELEKAKLTVYPQKGLPFKYESVYLPTGYRVDLLVENKLIVEIKSVERLIDVHYKQLLTYLKLSDLKLGLLVNFNCSNINDNIKRVVYNL